MSNNFLRLILNKPLKNNPSELEYHYALDEFIWDIGCITGWDREIIETHKILLSYSCTTHHLENDQEYLNKWIEEIKNSHTVSITYNTEVSGEIIINFEEN